MNGYRTHIPELVRLLLKDQNRHGIWVKAIFGLVYRWFKTQLDRNRHQLVRLFSSIFVVYRPTKFPAGHVWL
jgi:hypothetical protein